MAARHNDGTYCSSLTDVQVQNVYDLENDRVKRYQDNPEMDAYKVAKELRQEAKEELLRRGIWEGR